MGVMDGLPDTVLHNAVKEYVEEVSEILEPRPPVAEPTEVVAPKKPEVVTLTNEERLQAANLSLTVQNLLLIKERITREANDRIEQVNKKITDTQAEINQFQQLLTVKYGIDFSKQQIEPSTGRVISGG